MGDKENATAGWTVAVFEKKSKTMSKTKSKTKENMIDKAPDNGFYLNQKRLQKRTALKIAKLQKNLSN